MTMKSKSKFWLPSALLVVSLSGLAQDPVSLTQAIDMAMRKNERIQASQYSTEVARESRKTATDIGKLSAMWMHGQYNSIYQDNNFTLSQSLPFPTQLSSQVRLGREQLTGAQKELRAVQNDIAYEVKSAYYQLIYLRTLDTLLQSQDSLYENFAKASSARFRTGEGTLLEKTTAETQWMESQNQLRLNHADIRIAQARLQAVLKNETPVLPIDPLVPRSLPDTLGLAGNPQLDYMQQQVVIGHRLRVVESNRILPDITLGYFNQTLIGVQNVNGQDQYFGRDKKFQGFEVGLAIPLWFGPHVARARAAGVQEEVLKKNADYFKTSLTSAHVQALQEVEKDKVSLEYFQSGALKNAEFILLQAGRSYRAGEIGYVEFLQAVRNALSIRSGYLSALNSFNQSVIKLEYLYGIY